MIQGIGLGLRSALYKQLMADCPPCVSWLEIHPENYLFRGGHYQTMLEEARARFPLLTHGLTMGFGSLAPFDAPMLKALRGLLEAQRAPFHSDHLCFASAQGVYLHDLLPLPTSREALVVCVDRVRQMQDALGIPVAVEHISYYATPPGSQLSESDFLCELLERADAKLLLDVNNVYVNAMNHRFDAHAFIARLPLQRVVQLHVAGHYVRPDGLRIDTHAEPICEDVFALLEHTLGLLGRPLPVLLERDDNFPDFAVLKGELERLDAIYRRAMAGLGDEARGPQRVSA